jgi:endonuclease III
MATKTKTKKKLPTKAEMKKFLDRAKKALKVKTWTPPTPHGETSDGETRLRVFIEHVLQYDAEQAKKVERVWKQLGEAFVDRNEARVAKAQELQAILEDCGISQAAEKAIWLKNILESAFVECNGMDVGRLITVEDERDVWYFLGALPGLPRDLAEWFPFYALGRDWIPMFSSVLRVAQRAGWVSLDMLPETPQRSSMKDSPPFNAVRVALERIVAKADYRLFGEVMDHIGREICTAAKCDCGKNGTLKAFGLALEKGAVDPSVTETLPLPGIEPRPLQVFPGLPATETAEPAEGATKDDKEDKDEEVTKDEPVVVADDDDGIVDIALDDDGKPIPTDASAAPAKGGKPAKEPKEPKDTKPAKPAKAGKPAKPVKATKAAKGKPAATKAAKPAKGKKK